MFLIAGQTTLTPGLKFCVDTHGQPGGDIGQIVYFFYFQNLFFPRVTSASI